jgi:hypothetical protein
MPVKFAVARVDDHHAMGVHEFKEDVDTLDQVLERQSIKLLVIHRDFGILQNLKTRRLHWP